MMHTCLQGVIMAQLPLLLEPEQLHHHLQDPGVFIVDMRSPESYAQGHIPGAVNLAYSDIVRAAPPVGGLLPDPQRLGTVLGALGLTPEHQVVVYDEKGGGRAGRLLWTLDVLGHAHCSVVNGGLPAWISEQRPLQTTAPAAGGASYPAVLRNPDVLAEKRYILDRLGAADFIPLDTRTPAEFAGIDVRAARGGHIPGAVNLDWVETIDRDSVLRLKPDRQLIDMLGQLGVTRDKEVVVYCQTHHRSSHTYLVLRHLAFPRVRGYAGAWSDWGNDPTTPIER